MVANQAEFRGSKPGSNGPSLLYLRLYYTEFPSKSLAADKFTCIKPYNLLVASDACVTSDARGSDEKALIYVK